MMPPPMTTTRARSGSLPPADDEADEDDGDDEGEDADGPDDGSDIGGYYRKAIRACVGAGARRRLAYDGGAAAAGWACNAAHSGHARGACGTSWRCSSRTAREISARSRRTSRRAPATRAIFM